MRAVGLYLLLFFVLIISCKKDDEINLVDDNNKNEILIGDYSDMIVNYYDTVLIGGYNHPKSFDIDLNNDGSSDVRLISEVWGSPGLGQNPRSTIECLTSNVQLLGYYANDTSFLNKTTTVSGPPNAIRIDIYNTYSCHRLSQTDTILSVALNDFKMLPQNKGDIIKKQNEFKSDTIILIGNTSGYPPLVSGNGIDTTIVEHNTFDQDCNPFPLEEIKYIGIKVIQNNVQKIGWIKLSIVNRNKIFILESVIQK